MALRASPARRTASPSQKRHWALSGWASTACLKRSADFSHARKSGPSQGRVRRGATRPAKPRAPASAPLYVLFQSPHFTDPILETLARIGCLTNQPEQLLTPALVPEPEKNQGDPDGNEREVVQLLHPRPWQPHTSGNERSLHALPRRGQALPPQRTARGEDHDLTRPTAWRWRCENQACCNKPWQSLLDSRNAVRESPTCLLPASPGPHNTCQTIGVPVDRVDGDLLLRCNRAHATTWTPSGPEALNGRPF